MATSFKSGYATPGHASPGYASPAYSPAPAGLSPSPAPFSSAGYVKPEPQETKFDFGLDGKDINATQVYTLLRRFAVTDIVTEIQEGAQVVGGNVYFGRPPFMGTTPEGEVESARIAELTRQHEADLRQLEEERDAHRNRSRKLFRALRDLRGNIRVMCRIRPAPPHAKKEELTNFGEKYKGEFTSNWGRIVMDLPLPGIGTNTQTETFDFERVFGDNETNNDVFEEIEDLVDGAFVGENIGIFCYGQSGSGKTHTLTFKHENDYTQDGVIPRALRKMLEIKKANKCVYKVTLTIEELYINQVYDLLDEKAKSNIGLGKAQPILLSSTGDAYERITKAMDRREVSPTKMNPQSSRSHLLLTFRMERKDGQGKIGRLYIADLAGSEMPAATGMVNGQFKEGVAINESLVALNVALEALAHNRKPLLSGNLLTKALRPVLQKQSKSLMFVMVSPYLEHIGATAQTLKRSRVLTNRGQRMEEPKKKQPKAKSPQSFPTVGHALRHERSVAARATPY
ncbi:P-loop containing nucleoside triphosphate hydrolase protein [Hypomontagnella monticulosa]|nr:P-loop containing nucleoside triphosphate hydrolase protein [Hypomontagnella monticulosa]